MSEPSAKKQKTQSLIYELLYHPSIPGRGEFVRLVFEATSTPYSDIANAQEDGYSTVQQICITNKSPESVDGNPPVFSPPALRVSGAGRDGESLVISQTGSILQYLGGKLGMAGKDEAEGLWVQQIALTALDLNNEVHDTHHPLAVMKYYEDQKDAALLKAQDVRENRIPKFFAYFTRQLKWNAEQGQGKYLVGSSLTYADTTVWQVLDGLQFAFPKELAARKAEFQELFEFYESVKNEKEVKAYLESERRLKYSMGVFRHYPELDRQD